MASSPLPPTALASSSSSLVLASGSSLIAYSATTGQISRFSPASSTTSQVDGLIRHLALSYDNKYAATIGDDKSLCVYDLSSSGPSLRSKRTATKRASHLTFTPTNELLLSDKVGDTYLYPLDPDPEAVSAERPQLFKLHSDPSQNPDATLLLGHTSIITQHILAPGGKRLITADRDEHIRISRFPSSYVIDKYLFGSDGFVSALHIPSSRPDVLLSAGGERELRIWDWQAGKQIGGVDILEPVLPHRKARSHMRRSKAGRKRLREEEDDFLSAPEGWMLPSGHGVCIKKIESVNIDGPTVVLFFSEGCSAIHSFLLDSDPSSNALISVHTQALDHPVLDLTSLPGQPDHLLVSLDTAWGVLRSNPEPGSQAPGKASNGELSEADNDTLSRILVVVRIGLGGELALVPDHPLLPTLHSALSDPSLLVSPASLAKVQLYPLLPLLPRWPGFEEDEDLAGPPLGDEKGGVDQPGGMGKKGKKAKLAKDGLHGSEGIASGSQERNGESSASARGEPSRTYTYEELEKMGLKALGRLKSQGVDVFDLIYEKTKGKKRPQTEKANGREKVGEAAGAEQEIVAGAEIAEVDMGDA